MSPTSRSLAMHLQEGSVLLVTSSSVLRGCSPQSLLLSTNKPCSSASPCPKAFPAELSPAQHLGLSLCRDWGCPRGKTLCLASLSLLRLLWPFLQPTQDPLEGGFAPQHIEHILFSDCISVDLLSAFTSNFLNSDLLASLLTVAFSTL